MTARLFRFVPKRRDDLRPEMAPFVGRVAEFFFAGAGGDGEPFPGQGRWQTHPASGWPPCWVPDEDLEPMANA